MFKIPKTFKNLAFASSRTPTSDPGEHIQLFFLTRKKPLTRIHTRTCMCAHNNKALTHVFSIMCASTVTVIGREYGISNIEIPAYYVA